MKNSSTQSLVPFSLIESLHCLENIYEARLFSWILAKAQYILKFYNRDLGCINMQFALNMARVTLPAKMLLAPGDDNYKDIPKAFGLANKTVDYTSNTGNVYKLNIIAFPEYVRVPNGRSYVTFVIHNQLWHAILDNFEKGYRIVNLLDIFKLTSRYSVILYFLLSNQKKFQVSPETLRKLLGCPDSYKKWNNLENRVIKTSISDIHRHTSCVVKYTKQTDKDGRGAPITMLLFEFHKNKSEIDPERNNEYYKLSSMLSDEVQQELARNFNIEGEDIRKFEPLLLKMGDSNAQLHLLDRVINVIRRKRVENPKGYLYRSLLVQKIEKR